MIKKIVPIFIVTLFLIPLLASSSFGEKFNYYDGTGKKIEKADYEKLVNVRKPKVNSVLKGGYGGGSTGFKDPVLLRKKRIRQWKLYRQSRR
jgi:hypothetical protein